jgi:hypothetical protein
MLVGCASVNMVNIATNDERLEHDFQSDHDLEIYDWDTAYFCVSAYAGGTPWGMEYDPSKALEFWLWYLEEVKTVYEGITE